MPLAFLFTAAAPLLVAGWIYLLTSRQYTVDLSGLRSQVCSLCMEGIAFTQFKLFDLYVHIHIILYIYLEKFTASIAEHL